MGGGQVGQDKLMGRDERTRAVVFFLLLALLALLLACRLAVLQLRGSVRADQRARRQFDRTRELPAARGTIVDRNGELLCYDTTVHEVLVELSVKAGDGMAHTVPAEVARAFARVLAPEPERQAALAREFLGRFRMPANAGRRHVVEKAGVHEYDVRFWVRPLATGVTSAATLDRLQAVATEHRHLRDRGFRVDLQVTSRCERSYPLGDDACHVTGMLSFDHETEHERVFKATGLEALSVLRRGQPGRADYRVDAALRPYHRAPPQPPEPPSLVRTTIDVRLQEAADRILDLRVDPEQPDWSTLLLLDLADGAILALANHPSFDPEAVTPGQKGFLCAATQAQYQPGSVVKPLFLALALEWGLIQPGEAVNCSGDAGPGSKAWRVRMGGRERYKPIEDDHFVGLTTVEGVLVQSSNIGAVKLGMRLLPDRFAPALDFYQFGQRTQIGLPHEARGSRPEGRHLKNDRELYLYTAPSVFTGYQLDVTPMQLARAFGVLLTGHTFAPRLVEEVVTRSGERLRPGQPARTRVLSEGTVNWVRQAMADVVSSPHGTARITIGQDESIHGLIGGKTGTSFRLDRSGKRVYGASFVGFAPVSNPRYLAVCAVQKSSTYKFYGNKHAAPAVRDLLLEALGGASGGSPPVRSGAVLQDGQVGAAHELRPDAVTRSRGSIAPAAILPGGAQATTTLASRVDARGNGGLR